ncbi:MAG: DNA gyrase/topoisomerase IV subunit A, partial [Bacteroidota bacterium]
HFASLEKIFIREEMYIEFKNYSDKESLFQYLYNRFAPHKKKLLRAINDDDLTRLTQIPMIRITRFDSIKAEAHMKDLDDKIAQVKNYLENLIEYAVDFFKTLKKKYGEGRERKTEIKTLETIEAKQVVMNNEKLYVNREEGFVGTGLKKDEFVCDCSDLDDIIAFTREGKMKVVKVTDKAFIGKGIIHIAIFKKNDERTTYNMIYRDGPKGITFMKRFNVVGVTRDKEYDLGKGTPGTEVFWFTVNPNGEAEKVLVHLRQVSGLRKFEIDVDFSEMQVKSRGSVGNIVTKYTPKKVTLKQKGKATVGAEDIWFDETVHRLNKDGKGTFLGKFLGDDKILTITSTGNYKLYSFDLVNHFDEDIVMIEKFYPQQMIAMVYFDGESGAYFTKRFLPETVSAKTVIIPEHKDSHVEFVTTQSNPFAEVIFSKEKGNTPNPEKINLNDFVPPMGMKAKGKRLTQLKVKEVNLLNPTETENDYDEDTGLSPVELHKRALNRLKGGKDKGFFGEDGQTKLRFD